MGTQWFTLIGRAGEAPDGPQSGNSSAYLVLPLNLTFRWGAWYALASSGASTTCFLKSFQFDVPSFAAILLRYI